MIGLDMIRSDEPCLDQISHELPLPFGPGWCLGVFLGGWFWALGPLEVGGLGGARSLD